MNKFLISMLLMFTCLSVAESNEIVQVASYKDGTPYMGVANSANASHVTYASDKDLELLIKSGYSIVDFFAVWCGPCRNLSPIFEKVSGDLHESIKFVKVDIDQCPLSDEKYKIELIPTLIIFKDGKQIAHRVGGCTEAQLKTFIFDSINKK